MTVGVAIITHNAKRHLFRCLAPLLDSPLKPAIVVVNSSSDDGTVELAKDMGVDTLIIPRPEFNHGLTRELARKYLNTDIVVMMTPDAYMTSHNTLSFLIAPLLEGKASVSYARQISHDGAGFFESFPRCFNYPPEDQLRGAEDRLTYGVYTYFCSNSCAAYLNSALDEIGGFRHVLLGEDTLAVAMLLKNGHKIAYRAKALVKHSHKYSLKQEFQRNFDTGLARKSYKKHFAGSSDTGRGVLFFKAICKTLLRSRPYLLPYAIAHCSAKYTGYLMGAVFSFAPNRMKQIFSSQDFYWNSLQSAKKR